jgi:O-antigen/teichoic acid export membrane protein
MKEKIITAIKSNKFLIQSVNTLLLRIIGVITLFGFTLFLTHNYNAKIIGQYDFIRTFILVVGTMCLLGTEQSILYFTGVLKGENSLISLKNIYYKTVAIIFATSIMALLIIIIVGERTINLFFNDENIFLLLLKSTICIFFFCITTFNTEVLRALDKIYLAELFRNTFKYLSVIIGSIYLFTIHEENFLVDTFLLGFVLLAIISFLIINQIFNREFKTSIIQTTTTKYTYKHIINKSYPMAVSAMAIFLLMSFDIMFLKKYKGDEDVAYYGVAIKLMTMISMVINTINVTVSTKTAELYNIDDKLELQKVVTKSSRIIFLLSFPMILFFCFFSEKILSIFGENYTYAKEALIILVIGQGICSLFGVSQIYLNMTGRQRHFQIILIFSVFINFTLKKVLIPKKGIIGAAIAYSISMIFWNLIVTYYVYKQDKVKLYIH